MEAYCLHCPFPKGFAAPLLRVLVLVAPAVPSCRDPSLLSHTRAFLRGGLQPVAEQMESMYLPLFYPHGTPLTGKFAPKCSTGLAEALSGLRGRLRPPPGQCHSLPFLSQVSLPFCALTSISTSGSQRSHRGSQQSDSKTPAPSDTLSSLSFNLEGTFLQLREWLLIGSRGFTPSRGKLLQV